MPTAALSFNALKINAALSDEEKPRKSQATAARRSRRGLR
jgi:hypothetical protein